MPFPEPGGPKMRMTGSISVLPWVEKSSEALMLVRLVSPVLGTVILVRMLELKVPLWYVVLTMFDAFGWVPEILNFLDVPEV